MTRGKGDRGAVLIIVAAFAIVAVLMLAFVIDIGGLRQEKKEVTLSTDAAALAIAAQLDLRTFGVGQYDCAEVPVRRQSEADPMVYAQSVADTFLAKNGGTTGDECRVQVTGPRRGYVVVGGLEDVEYAFAGAVGQPRGRVSGVSASVARVDFGGGLRPLGLCAGESTINSGPDGPYNLTDDVLDAPKSSDGTLDDEIDAVIALEHLDRDSGCSVQAAGRRGQLNLDPSQNGNGGNQQCSDSDPDPQEADDGFFTTEYRYGYQGEIDEWTLSDGGADYKGLEACFDRDILEEQLIWLPIFDAYRPPPEGTLRIVGFAQAQLTGYCISNAKYRAVPTSIGCLADIPEENGPGKPWLRMTITRVVDFGETGPPLTDDSLRDSPAICAEKDEAALLSNCVPPNPPPRGTPADPNPPPQPPEPPECVGLTITGSQTRDLETANGSDRDKLTVPAVYTFTVEDGDACSISVELDDGNPGNDPEASAIDRSGNTFTITFARYDQRFTRDATYTVQLLNDDQPFSPAVFTELVTNP